MEYVHQTLCSEYVSATKNNWLTFFRHCGWCFFFFVFLISIQLLLFSLYSRVWLKPHHLGLPMRHILFGISCKIKVIFELVKWKSRRLCLASSRASSAADTNEDDVTNCGKWRCRDGFCFLFAWSTGRA